MILRYDKIGKISATTSTIKTTLRTFSTATTRIAATTTRGRLRPGVLVAPFYHSPAKLNE